MKDMFKLDNKIAIVTGGAGGIGEVLAMALGIHGATAVVSSRNQEAIEEVAGRSVRHPVTRPLQSHRMSRMRALYRNWWIGSWKNTVK